ncbi:protein archease isoform X1 [Phacochoerus africanus]|nr:protein archease isoform X1 [Phacochoerus africanus]
MEISLDLPGGAGTTTALQLRRAGTARVISTRHSVSPSGDGARRRAHRTDGETEHRPLRVGRAAGRTRREADLDHTADVQLHAWGDTLEEAFEQCAMAMFGYMTDTGTVEPLQTMEVETQGDDLQSLLFHFLDEWLYKFSADEFFIPREVKVLNIDQRNFKLRSIGWGEEFSLSKHPQGTEVKAITYSAMQVYNEEKPEVFVIIDI